VLHADKLLASVGLQGPTHDKSEQGLLLAHSDDVRLP
jgi:hypothetical protein